MGVLLAMEDVEMGGEALVDKARGFWDSGATICLCTPAWAAKAGLVGVKTAIHLKVVHHSHERVESRAYTFEVKDREGACHTIKAFGVDSISSEKPFLPTETVLQAFPGLQSNEVSRPGGSVNILFGMDVVGLHPVEESTIDNTRLLRSRFGTGRILVGVMPGERGCTLDANAVRLAQGTWEEPPDSVTISHA